MPPDISDWGPKGAKIETAVKFSQYIVWSLFITSLRVLSTYCHSGREAMRVEYYIWCHPTLCERHALCWPKHTEKEASSNQTILHLWSLNIKALIHCVDLVIYICDFIVFDYPRKYLWCIIFFNCSSLLLVTITKGNGVIFINWIPVSNPEMKY